MVVAVQRSWRTGLAVVLLVVLVVATTTASRSGVRWAPDAPDPATHPVGAVRTESGVIAPILSTFDGGWWVRTPCYRMAPVFAATPVADVDIVLDPGHGGAEDGAPGVDGIKEKDVNVAVARRVATLLRERGHHVVLTHQRDDFLTLHTRGEIATAIGPKLMVSIHHNAVSTNPLPHPGTEAIHQLRSARSKALAEALFAEVRRDIARFDVPWVGSADARPATREGEDGDWYGILRYSGGVPTAIVEAGYINNPAEARLFVRRDYQEVEATAIANAIEQALTTFAEHDFGAEPSARPSPGAPAEDADGCIDPPLEGAAD